jgi:predicted transcriptional regulator
LKGFEAMADDSETPGASDTEILHLGSEIVSAFVTRNAVSVADLPDLIRSVHQSLKALQAEGDEPPAAPAAKQKPAVPISRSVQNDYIVCLEDGKRLTMLKRYLRARYDMSPEDYRRKWGLSPDYPMVAPAYSERRSKFAKEIGLGKGGRRS